MSRHETYDELLAGFTEHFYGYGDYDGDFWFIGMEEGGGNVDIRLSQWDERGRRELEDLAGFHYAIGMTEWFEPKSKLQPTWSKYVRIILAAEGKIFSTECIRQYQTHQLGRSGNKSCLIELLPLPSRTGITHSVHRSPGYRVDKRIWTTTPLDAVAIFNRHASNTNRKR